MLIAKTRKKEKAQAKQQKKPLFLHRMFSKDLKRIIPHIRNGKAYTPPRKSTYREQRTKEMIVKKINKEYLLFIYQLIL